MTNPGSTDAARSPFFATTHWSVVGRARGGPGSGDSDGDAERDAALSTLCETYWYPVYAFARRKGHGVDDAKDLVQSFFTRLLEHDDLAQADAGRGRFRSYLLGCFVHFRANEWKKARAEKRGGDRVGFSLDHERAEGRFHAEPSVDDDPERVFARTFAQALMEKVVVRLRAEYEEGGKSEVFEHLKSALTGDPDAASYLQIAEATGTTEGAVKVAVHRLRKRFGSLLRREIAHTLRDPEDLEDEIRGLFEALAAD